MPNRLFGTRSGDLEEWKANEMREMLEQMQEMRRLRMEDLVKKIGEMGNKQTEMKSKIEAIEAELPLDPEMQLLADFENKEPFWRDSDCWAEISYRKQHLTKLLEQEGLQHWRQEPREEREEEQAKREERQLQLKERRLELESELQQESRLVQGRGWELTREVQRVGMLEQQISSVEEQLRVWEEELRGREWGPERGLERWMWELEWDWERRMQQQHRQPLWEQLQLQVWRLGSRVLWWWQRCRQAVERWMGHRAKWEQEWEEGRVREWEQAPAPALQLELKLDRMHARKRELQQQLKQLSNNMKDHHLKWMDEQLQRTQKSNTEWTQKWPQEPTLPQAMVVSGLEDWLKLPQSFRQRRTDLIHLQLELGEVWAELQRMIYDKESLERCKEDCTQALQDASSFRRPLHGLDHLARIWLLAFLTWDYLPLGEDRVEERVTSLRRQLRARATLLDVILSNQTAFAGKSPYLDGLLVFAGLFSAVLAAFLIEVRKGLQEDLLLQILHQLQSTQQPFQPTLVSVWTNGLWFSSLAASLMGALVLILAKSFAQWTISGKNAKAIFFRPEHLERRWKEIRRLHMHTNLERTIASLIAAAETLLYVALILFFSGFSLLLYTTQRAIGIGFIAITSPMVLYTFGVGFHNFYVSLGSR